MPPLRLRPFSLFSRLSRPAPSCTASLQTLRTYATRDPYSDRLPTNDPNPPEPVKNVSDTNATPVSAMGLRDAPLQEMPEDSEKQRQMQAPNRKGVWSRSQESREKAMSGPRFEQTLMEFQVRTRLWLCGGCVILGVRWRCKGGGEGRLSVADSGIGMEMDAWRKQMLTLGLAIASTRSCNNFDPSTTRTLDKEQDSSMRWRRRTIGAPSDLHQRR
jgi:hypothetical protein